MASCGDDDGDDGKAATSRAEAPASETSPAATTTSAAGAVPDACRLFTAAEVADQVGKGPERKRDSGTSLDGHAFSQCRWTAEPRDMGVAVIASTARYETHRKLPDVERVSGLGDKAIVRESTSLETQGGTGGHTVAVVDGDRTLVVALDRGGTVSTADVVALARVALGRLR